MNTERSSAPILEVEDIKKSFGGNRVLRGVSFALPSGSVTALIGSNGAGKSTFLNILSGFIPSDSGNIRLKRSDITATSSYERARFGLGRTFQHPRSFRSLTVRQSVAFATTTSREESIGRGLLRSARDAIRRGDDWNHDVEQCLERCRLADKASVQASELSYGDQKLLMLAQTLAYKGDVLCLDELCAGLEPAVVTYVGDMIRSIAGEGKTVLFVEHNLELVRNIAESAVFFHEGCVFRSGRTEDVLSDPEVIRLYLGN